MRKDITYTLRVVFSSTTSDSKFAICGCPAGHGPQCTCKHLACFCYFIEEFCRHGTINYSSATSSLQQWHQPRKRSSTPCTVNNIKFTKVEYGKVKRVISTNYDPRPQHLQSTTSKEISHLRHQLSSLNGTTVALLHVIPVDADTGLSISCIATAEPLPSVPKSVQSDIHAAINEEPRPIQLSKLQKYESDFLSKITYSVKDVVEVEVTTRAQSKSSRWYEEHHCRITASNFGTFCKGSVTTNKLKSLLYSGFKSTISSSAILWGRTNEASAFRQYEAAMPDNFILRESEIYVSSKHGFLAASPDGIVMSSSEDTTGVIEIKCPYVCRNVTVIEACTQKGFCCELVSGKVCLKRNHQYYYQIQGSMAIVGVEWCDFIVWTTKDMSVERIAFDSTFWTTCVHQLQFIYQTYVLPEIIYPKLNNYQLFINEP